MAAKAQTHVVQRPDAGGTQIFRQQLPGAVDDFLPQQYWKVIEETPAKVSNQPLMSLGKTVGRGNSSSRSMAKPAASRWQAMLS